MTHSETKLSPSADVSYNCLIVIFGSGTETHRKSDHSSLYCCGMDALAATGAGIDTGAAPLELAGPRLRLLGPGGGGRSPIPPDVLCGFRGRLPASPLPAIFILIVSPSLKLKSSFGASAELSETTDD